MSALARARWVERGVGEGVCWEAAFRKDDAIEDRAGADTEQWSDASGRQSGIAHGGVAHQCPSANDRSPACIGTDLGDVEAELRRHMREHITDEGLGIDGCRGRRMPGRGLDGECGDELAASEDTLVERPTFSSARQPADGLPDARAAAHASAVEIRLGPGHSIGDEGTISATRRADRGAELLQNKVGILPRSRMVTEQRGVAGPFIAIERVQIGDECGRAAG